jgi:hypothetical protein
MKKSLLRQSVSARRNTDICGLRSTQSCGTTKKTQFLGYILQFFETNITKAEVAPLNEVQIIFVGRSHFRFFYNYYHM